MSLALRRLYSTVLIFSLVAAIMMVTPRPVQAGSTIVVNTFVDKYGNSNSCSLRDAITAANEDVYFAGCGKGSGADTIVLKAGTYQLSRTGSGDGLPGSGDLDITSSLTIVGQGSQGASGTFIVATGLGDRAIHIRPTSNSGNITVKLTGLSINGGSTAAGDGGGISSDTDPVYPDDHVDLQLDNVVIKGNQAGTISVIGLGGGIYNGPRCTLSISRATIADNQSSYGGGIFNYGTLSFTNSSITGNRAWKLGGGVDSRPQSSTDQVSIIGTTISANTVTNTPQETGGMTGSGRLIIQNSLFTGNTGVALKISGSTATISGSSFTDNEGIGLSLLSGTNATITDTTFVQNATGLSVVGGASAVVTNGTFSGNSQVNAASAAGIDSAGTLTLLSGSVTASAGGAIFLKNGGTSTITSVLVNGNAGVGLRVDDGATATVTNTSVTGNTSTDLTGGSGIVSAGSLILQNSTVAENTGIGLKVNSSATADMFTQVTNSTIAANTAPDPAQGVGIVNAGKLHLLYVTLANNSGTGLLLENGSNTEIQNTIIERHAVSNCTNNVTASLTSQGHNLLYNFPLPASGNCSFSGTGDVEVQIDPLSGQLISNGGPTRSYAIVSPDSPAVDAVPVSDQDQCPAENQIDQRWLARPVDGNKDNVNGCDIGAFEFGAPFYTQLLPSISR
jgi:CSLREA domain-containing protein